MLELVFGNQLGDQLPTRVNWDYRVLRRRRRLRLSWSLLLWAISCQVALLAADETKSHL
jgi:hypothetical protein